MSMMGKAQKLPWLGYALYWAWMLVCFRGPGVFLPSMVPQSDVAYDPSLPFMCSIMAHAVAHFGWGMLALRHPVVTERIPWVEVCVMGAAPLFAAVVLGSGEVDNVRRAFVIVCAVVTGVASAPLDACWSQRYGAEEPSESGRFIALSAAAGVLLYYLLVLLGAVLPAVRLIAVVVLPPACAQCLVTCACMQRVKRSESRDNDVARKTELKECVTHLTGNDVAGAFGILWRPVAGSLVLFFMYDCMSTLVGATWSGAYTHGLALLPQVLAALALCLFTRPGERISIGATYGAAFVLVCAGFLLLPVVAQLPNGSAVLLVASVLSWAGGSVFDIMVLIMVAHAAYDYRLPGGTVNAFVRSATLGASALGAIVGWRLSGALWVDSLAMTIFAQAVLFAAIASAALLLGRRRLAALLPDVCQMPEVYEVLAPNPRLAGPRHAGGAVTGEDPNEVARIAVLIQVGDGPEDLGCKEQSREDSDKLARQVEEYRARRIADVAHIAGLSRRETDVFALMVAGRSAPFIAEKLVISENTVNSHVRRIYGKLGVHSKQALLDLVEENGE